MYCGGAVIIREATQLVSGVNIGNLMQLAKAAADAGNPKEAYGYYLKVLEHEGQNPEAWFGKGSSAGWMSTFKEMKTNEMVSGFKNAIAYASESEKNELRKRCSVETFKIVTACYTIAKRHLDQFAAVQGVWAGYVQSSALCIDALDVAIAWNPIAKPLSQLLVKICRENLEGFRCTAHSAFNFFGLPIMENRFSVPKDYAAFLNAQIAEHERRE